MVGLWLLVPEHLRLGTWDLLQTWTGQPTCRVEPRLALQLVHEAALCVTGVREQRCLTMRGFELLNGLPFLANDTGVHVSKGLERKNTDAAGLDEPTWGPQAQSR